jgi:hypothetical protein
MRLPLLFVAPTKLRGTDAKSFRAKLEELRGVESPLATFNLADDLLWLLESCAELHLGKSGLFSELPQ